MSDVDEPFFDRLRALQPDIDIVILPPDQVAAEAEPADRADAIAAERGTRGVVDALLGESGLAVRQRTFHERWDRRDADVHEHRSRVTIVMRDAAEATEGLIQLGDILHAAGWEPWPVESPQPWFKATAPTGMQADVATQRERLVITIRSAPLRLEEVPA